MEADSEPDHMEDEEEELKRLDGDGEEDDDEADDIVVGDPKETVGQGGGSMAIKWPLKWPQKWPECEPEVTLEKVPFITSPYTPFKEMSVQFVEQF